ERRLRDRIVEKQCRLSDAEMRLDLFGDDAAENIRQVIVWSDAHPSCLRGGRKLRARAIICAFQRGHEVYTRETREGVGNAQAFRSRERIGLAAAPLQP